MRWRSSELNRRCIRQTAVLRGKDIVVKGWIFAGSEAPVAYVGVDGAVVRYSTIYRSGKWIMRILQETTAAR